MPLKSLLVFFSDFIQLKSLLEANGVVGEKLEAVNVD
jgi:hypothetical protein